MGVDLLTVGVGFVSFVIFLIIHFIAFRWLHPEQVLRSLLLTVIATIGLPLALMGLLFLFKPVDISPQEWACASVLAVVVQGLLCFAYVLCVFGPYETSVRMRLVREISGAEGISFQELSRRYNHETIVSIRLRRLLGSGDIIEEGGLYRSRGNRNFFFVFDAIAGVLKKWINQ